MPLSLHILQVVMLDYGFKEIVNSSSLRPILKHFRDARCYSFCCHLAGVTPAGGNTNWSHTASEFMEEQIKSKKLYISRKVGSDYKKFDHFPINQFQYSKTCVKRPLENW